jgi:hypothetical protein
VHHRTYIFTRSHTHARAHTHVHIAPWWRLRCEAVAAPIDVAWCVPDIATHRWRRTTTTT